MNDQFVIIVPARSGSTRLPNKPLSMINGRTLISRVLDLAKSSQASDIYVATDSNEIKEHVESIGINVVMTSSNHISGMDRIAEAANILNLDINTSIVNLQGDEPFMPVNIINQLPTFLSEEIHISTACIKFTNEMDVSSQHEVKVTRSNSKRAMYFSRSVIPNSFSRDHKNYMKHLGIYSYKNKTLQMLTKLDPSSNEKDENLEQLRFLDNGFNIYVQDYDCKPPIGVDTAEDLKAAIKYAVNND